MHSFSRLTLHDTRFLHCKSETLLADLDLGSGCEADAIE